jgi:hypothetical protein
MRKSPMEKKKQQSPPPIEPQKVFELGNGLELWKVPPSALREQDVNARSMPKAMFERLAQTIGRDKRLESLPLCDKTERGLEIVSGHHRVPLPLPPASPSYSSWWM